MGAAVGVASLLFAAFVGRDDHAGVSVFVGRFHPLAVHLPIGVLLLAGLLEGLALSPRLRARIDPAFAIILRFALVSLVVAFVIGLMLASGGGYPERLVRLHQRLAFGTVLGSAASVVMWSMHVERRVSRLPHRLVLGGTLALLAIGAHFGGSMTHGESYLVQHAPSFAKRWLDHGDPRAGAPPPGPSGPVSAPRVFDDVVLPVLTAKCASCHGAEMAKGQLRLDSFEALMKGGKAGPAALVGDATRSLVVRRITSSISDDAHMPPEGKPQLTPEEIELIVLWIDGGASSATKVRDLIVPDGARRLLVKAAERASEREQVEARAASVPAATVAPVPSVTTREASSPPPASSSDDDFRARIAPILAAKCGRCHGAEKQKGKLRTDSLAALFEGGESGPAIVPRDPGRGTLLHRIRLPIEDAQHMPPRDAPQLDASELRLLSRWLTRSAVIGSPASRRSEAPSERTTIAGEPIPTSRRSEAPSERATIAREPIATASSPNESTRLFVDVVQPILLNRCGACHSGAHPSGGFVIADLDALLARSYVLPGDPSASPLLSRMTSPLTDDDHMPPKRAPQPSQAEIDAVRLWIERGASVSGGDTKDVPPVLARTPNATTTGTLQEEEEPSRTDVTVQRANVRGGCAGCAVKRPDVPERLAFGVGPLLLALLALRRRSSLRARCGASVGLLRCPRDEVKAPRGLPTTTS